MVKKRGRKPKKVTIIKENRSHTKEQREHIKFAIKECANYMSNRCLNGYECKIFDNKKCNYFEVCVKPLIK